MANRTVKDAKSIRGTNPQYLIEKIIRSRIYDSKYWKEECFALTAELLVDKAMELRYLGGVFGGNIKPTPFLCLILKMLQIQPEKDIIVEFIKNEEFKYVRALGALYMRLTGSSLDCYKYLEPLFNDSRKLRIQNKQGVYEVIHMDEFIDMLLREERSCDIILPRIQKRHVLEESNELEAKVSALEDDIDEGIESSDDEEMPPVKDERKKADYDKDRERYKEREKRHSRSDKKSDRERDRSRSRDRKRERERERDRDRRDRDKDHRRRSDRERKDRDRERDRRRDRSRY
ncbi:pre-mRNA processing factor 38 [Cotesia typhae]